MGREPHAVAQTNQRQVFTRARYRCWHVGGEKYFGQAVLDGNVGSSSVVKNCRMSELFL
jgi:hypothetical protein